MGRFRLRDEAFGSAELVTGEFHRRPNSASKMFWAEAVATEVRSVVTVMPVTRMPLTPRLKRVWRRINKARVPRLARRRSPGAPSFNSFGDGRKYDLRVPGVRRLGKLSRWSWRCIEVRPCGNRT